MSADTSIPSPDHLTRQTILDLSDLEAREFLLKAESYCNLDLPKYIVFADLIASVNNVLATTNLSDLRCSSPRDFDDVNYTILHNKDGKFAWRPFQLIHPALYVSLVHAITEKDNWELICNRFRQFAANKNIHCLSMPVVSKTDQKDKAEQISKWWQEVEQRSIEMSLDYEYLIETDITDCYGAIYTHSIAWALHTKDEAKKIENRKNKNFIGNIIDNHVQDMRHGQTNGIPQGSVLMDFIAEMVLGLADLELAERIQLEGITDYRILRYRDDYRIFVNSPQVGEKIVKFITETTTNLGLKLSPAKTKANSNVVRASIKNDKLAWLVRKQSAKSLHKHLLIIHDHAMNFPNAGSLVTALNDYHMRILRVNTLSMPMPLLAVVVDIAYRNPRTYAICAAILSKLLSFVVAEEDRISTAQRIKKKFSQIPNTGHMDIWMQRITLPLGKVISNKISYDERICKLVSGDIIPLWNSDWISSATLKVAVDPKNIVDAKIRDEIAPVMLREEVELFLTKAAKGYY